MPSKGLHPLSRKAKMAMLQRRKDFVCLPGIRRAGAGGGLEPLEPDQD